MENTMVEIPPDVQADVRLEREVAASSDPFRRMLLVDTLADRYTWLRCEKYVERLRLHMKSLPPNCRHFSLAFLAAMDGQPDKTRQHFARYAERVLEDQETPPNSDFAWRFWQRQDCIESFLDENGIGVLRKSISDLFARKWTDAPISQYYEAVAGYTNDTQEQTRQKLSQTLSKTPDFWMASYTKGWVHLINEQWEDAAKCLNDAIKHESARRDPGLCYAAACTSLEANRNSNVGEAIASYLDCLERASGENGSPSADAVWLVTSRLETKFQAITALEMLMNAASDRWGQTAYLLHLRGFLALVEGDTDSALRYFVESDAVDNGFWLSAVAAARIYTREDNWNSAAGWFRRALGREGEQSFAYVWGEAAWCFGKIKSTDEEIAAYRRCLESDPKYQYGTNNLGWALLKAGKYEEAVDVLRRAIELETERRYAIGNLSRALTKMERYREAIDVLRQDKTKEGTLRKPAERRIAKLEELLQSKPQPPQNTEMRTGASKEEQVVSPTDLCVDEDVEELETDEQEEGAATPGFDKGPTARPVTVSERSEPVPLERILESLIEQKILRGDVVFNRKLRMYKSSDGFYGRQFPIPGIGFIDLLTEDFENGDLVVIELKRAQATREAIGQVSEYTGWVKKNLAKSGQRAVPVICLHEADERLRNAAEVVGIEVFEYDLSFR